MSRIQRLSVVLLLNLALVAGLVGVGLTARSLAVFAEGGDYLLDAAGVAVAIVAAWLSARPPSAKRPRGHPNATSTAALINAGWLILLELIVAAGAVDRLIAGTPQVSGLPVLLISGIAAIVMTIGAFILRGDDDESDDGDLSVAAVLLDTIADAAAAAGVAITGAIILAAGGLYWLDPAVALLIAMVISWHAVGLIRKVLAQPGQGARRAVFPA
ncbi:MAG TPA: cation diffusion facilitator family transporter [Streptosporangiaceae bacterium]|nr:cation diffusion facilitator family transporter [Streptosporangiaceae bacterium]